VTPTKLGNSGKPSAEHSIFGKRYSGLSGYMKEKREVFLLWIKLNYLKSNSQCPHIMGSNMAALGYLVRRSYKKCVTFNQSNLTRYLGKIIKGMS